MKLSPVIAGAILCHIAIAPVFSQSRPPQAVLSATSTAFGSQTVGVSSTVRLVTLSNPGGSALSVASISLTGMKSDFSVTTTCGATVAPGSSCRLTLAFTPSAVGPRSATVSITQNATGSQIAISITGTGALPQALISANTIPFPLVLVGTSFYAAPLSITNSGDVPLLLSASLTGTAQADYQIANACGSLVPAAGRCSIGVFFKPSALGSRPATLIISGNAPTLPLNIPLAGTGGAPQAVLTPTSLDFGTAVIRSTGNAHKATLSNPGALPLTIGNIAINGVASGDYRLTHTCGSTLASGAQCQATITFAPLYTSGLRPATLAIYQSATSTPVTVALVGASLAPLPVLSTTTVAFDPTQIASTAAPVTVTLTNKGTAALTISGVALSGSTVQFSESNNCPASLPVNQSCALVFSFKPVAPGSMTAVATISGNQSGVVSVITLSGTATAPQPVFSTTAVTFMAQPVGTSSSPSALTIKNTGNAPLVVSGFTVGGTSPNDFQVADNCAGSPIQPGSSCTAKLIFRPSATGPRSANATVTTNALLRTQSISLSGTATTPQVLLDRSAINFGKGSALLRPLTITNTGQAPLTGISISVAGPWAGAFGVQDNGCNATVQPGGTCIITVFYQGPLSPDSSMHAWLSLTDNAPGSPQRVDLVGGVASYSAKEVLIRNCSELGYFSRGMKINSRGQTVGYCLGPWDAGLLDGKPWEAPDIGSLFWGDPVQALAINDVGELVMQQGGLAYSNYLWPNHSTPYRTYDIQARDNNNSGWVAGQVTHNQTELDFHAAIQVPGNWRDIGLNSQVPANGPILIGSLAGPSAFSRATAINEWGNAAGYSDTQVNFVEGVPHLRHAFRYGSRTRSGMYDLGTLPNHKTSFAFGLNGDYTVGVSSSGYGYDPQVHDPCFEKYFPSLDACLSETAEAFIHTDVGGMKGLGQLGGTQSVAYAVDSSGLAVGTATLPTRNRHAFAYIRNNMLDLNWLLATPMNSVLTEATSINEAGQILVNAGGRVYILTPIP